MRGVPVWVIKLILLVLWLFSVTNSQYVDEDPVTQNDVYESHSYDRMNEVRKLCSSIINSASELKFDDNEIGRIKNDLSFYNADWDQLGHSSPLLPFDGRSPMKLFHVGYDLYNSSHSKSPYKLVSFKLTDISTAQRSKRSVGVNGRLQMVITSDFPLADTFGEKGPEFSMWQGHTQLFINFQGVYTESKRNSEEKVLCLLGDTMLPSRDSDSSDNPPTLLQDDEIILILHYPIKVSLERRAIRGEMRSLNLETNPKYFDTVRITSHPKVHASNYDFSSNEIISKACDPYPYPDPLFKSSIEIFKGLDFCTTLQRISTDAAFTVAPHWRCNGTDEFCRTFGPFGSDKSINSTDGSFKGVRILIQDILCVTKTHGNNGVARVSAVFRAFDSPDTQFIESQRSGLGNMTLVGEGIWNSSIGQLCMIGCVGNNCNSRICLYIPLSFSITQRSVLVGTISSIQHEKLPYFPLSIEMIYMGMDLYDTYVYDHPHYRYSKINAAGAVLEKNEPFSFGTVIKKSLLTFPKLTDSNEYADSLRLLVEDLTLHVTAFDPTSTSRPSRTDVQMEVLSLGPLFGRYWISNDSLAVKESPYHTKAAYTEKQLLLNVSSQLNLLGGPYSNFSVVFLEGIYDQHVGNMYLIGCRDARASWRLLYESNDLENGLDCLIEVVISYPPVTARWLMDPSATISISSTRPEDDPLYFKPFKLQTLPILYRQQREGILSRRGFEGILKIAALTIAIAFISSQLLYTRYMTDSLPYMSLVMLGTQVIGYGLPLIIGAKALSRRSNSESSESISSDLEGTQLTHVVDYTVKLLVLTCFILTLRLFQKVWKSRVKLLSQNSSDPRRVPSEKRVLIITVIIHVVGFIFALISHSVKTYKTPFPMENTGTFQTWEALFQEYIGLLQDLYLLPQVIGNIIWQINSQPLRKLYYMGITVIRLLPHVYDYVRGPVSNPFFAEEYEFVNQKFDFYSEFGDIAIPALAVVLAVIVYIQQRWSHEKISNATKLGSFKFFRSQSRMYEKLPTQLTESELVSCPVKHDVNVIESKD